MKRPFPHVALEPRGYSTIAVKVAVPFAELGVGEVTEAPFMNLLVPARVLRVARQRPSE